ncbi:TRAP transporter permease [Desulforhopalus singaporensis]|uniref:TRAP transporter, 4TM/12TM fusion protein n=1 Tax=Desulforhopalus singaporensis TaxID=91360 RepID=A0A1H0VEL9_9BACT|nr:TRAP transporter permease [Desulforhopalus singaporensis]SDP76791.1 TRAP transporter, 4TM/12TM fusion protein [Desulforhopalus singaporensis]
MELQQEKKKGFSAFAWQVVIVVATAGSLFHLYTAQFGLFAAPVQRSIHLLMGTVLTLALFPFGEGKRWGHPLLRVFDLILLLGGGFACAYMAFNYKELVSHVGLPTQTDIILGAALIVVVLEITRRTLGPALVIVALLALAYALFGDYIPGSWGHRGLQIDELLEYQYLTTEGVFSVALGASANFIFLFILFGGFMLKAGVGEFFNDLANKLAGHYDGGPAKVSVISSGFFAMISGAAVANVATTGVFTIPLMKRVGFKPVIAGAIESVASTGGQFMPPVMGAVAFIMADMLGVAYIRVCQAAILPGLLFFFALLYMVHLEAKRSNIKGVSKDSLPKLSTTLRRIHLVIPAVLLIGMLVMQYSATKAGFWSIVAAIGISSFSAETRMSFKTIIMTFVDSAKTLLPVMCACATAGIIIGVITQTGLGLKFASLIIEAAGSQLFPALIMVMLTCLILGMGLTVSASYIITVMIAGPVLIQLNVDPIAAHLFVVYYAVLSCITPPLALAAFAGAGIANTSPFLTAFQSMRLAAIAYIVPFLFVYNPALIWNGSVMEIFFACIQGVLACIAVGSALMGYLGGKRTGIIVRLLLFVASAAFFFPRYESIIAGAVLLIALWSMQKFMGSVGKSCQAPT